MILDLEGIQADSLIDMLKASFTLENWDSIIVIADKLYDNIENIYYMNQKEHKKISTFFLKRSIVYYFGFSMCLKGIALQKKGNSIMSRKCIEKYADLSWIKDMDTEGLKEVEYYRKIAVANSYVIDLNEGKRDVLQDYVTFIRENEDELLPGLLHILESAIRYDYTIDSILDEFEEKIDNNVEYYEKYTNIRYLIDYIYLLGKYYSEKGNHENAIKYTLRTLSLSVRLKDDTGFRKSAALYEFLREYTTPVHQHAYKNIMINILREGVKQ